MAEKEERGEKNRKAKELDVAGLEIGANALARATCSSDDEIPPQKKKQKTARSIIDLTCDLEMQFIEKEASHRQESEKKRLELDERRLVLAEENSKSQLDLMCALIAKLS
eukprot:IDg21626t1